MRLLTSLLPLALLSSAYASPGKKSPEKVLDIEDDKTSTVFNGKEVPPMTELAGGRVDDNIAQGNWYLLHLARYAEHLLTG